MSKREVINQRERAVSTDIDRLQSFRVHDGAEALRRELCTRTDQAASTIVYLESGSFANTSASDSAGIATPLLGDVHDGLVVLPQNGSLSLLVSPGVVSLDDPDGLTGSSVGTSPNPDDSRYKICIDAGITSLGILTMTAGAVATRIDLIECRRKQLVTEQANRDIYDATSGLFTSSLIDKVTDEQLEYRVRLGTPGSGIPALAQGWLPLAVVSVPTSATTTDGMQFWDVRPLVKDRVNAPFESRHVTTFLQDARLYANDHTDAAKCTLSGCASSHIGMYRCGGLFPLGPSIVDLRAAANHAAGYSPAVGFPYFVYAVFPGGLPRWVPYLPSPAVRTPNGPLGIIVVSEAGPGDDLGVNDTANPPAASGLITAGPRALLACGVVGTGPAEKGFVMTDGEIYVDPNNPVVASAPTTTSTTDKYALSPNAQFPSTCRKVFVRISASFSGATPGSLDLFHTTVNLIANDGSRLARAHDAELPFTYSSTGAATIQFSCWIPRAMLASANGEPDDEVLFNVEWSTTTTRGSQSCVVLGWKL